MDRGAWWAIVHGVTKESGMTQWLNNSKEAKDLYSKNYKITDERNQRWGKQIDIPCSEIGRINIVKMTILSKAIDRFISIPIKLPIAFFFFTELEQKLFCNLYGNTKDPEWPRQSWERKAECEESGSLTSDYATKLQ